MNEISLFIVLSEYNYTASNFQIITGCWDLRDDGNGERNMDTLSYQILLQVDVSRARDQVCLVKRSIRTGDGSLPT